MAQEFGSSSGACVLIDQSFPAIFKVMPEVLNRVCMFRPPSHVKKGSRGQSKDPKAKIIAIPEKSSAATSDRKCGQSPKRGTDVGLDSWQMRKMKSGERENVDNRFGLEMGKLLRALGYTNCR
eukprot:gnl/TRDRNA2_/TRDRNA2_179451_c0_seq1.p1 gnl/TRDRNA2_/TRDRNA2_179451_c0~~gnl/TRDRNA2_/TRDRNA2_179451_c0_seq1.p1  ORF type:complete len:123 (-),score=7.96 gnl/TRDRNA2_/TRDRNA2_179451_c0_seq1:154-522(-)